MAKKVLWDQFTSPQIGEAARAGGVVIVPLGATEQHGPHLPLHTDTEAVYDVALRAAQAIDERPVLVLPPLRWGFSPMHMTFPGTISLSWETFATLVTESAPGASTLTASRRSSS